MFFVYIHTIIHFEAVLFFLDLIELEGSDVGMIIQAEKACLATHCFCNEYLIKDFISVCRDGQDKKWSADKYNQ